MVQASEKLISSADLLARVQDVFRAELDDEALVVAPETSQKNLKAWDNLAPIRLVSGIESEVDIQFSLAEIAQITSVRRAGSQNDESIWQLAVSGYGEKNLPMKVDPQREWKLASAGRS
jgi:acyl carrier protein